MSPDAPGPGSGVAPIVRAAIVAVGSELLTPLRVDTNSLRITEQLNGIGIEVIAKAIVGDDRVELEAMVRALLPRVDLLVLSGGLGPTDDDVTRDTIAALLDRRLAEDPGITARMRARFAARGLAGPMPEINRRQAMVPAGATVIENGHGSAPGLWLDRDGRILVLLPGPPGELEPMLAAVVAGPLRARAAGVPLVRRILRIIGRLESQVDEALQPWYGRWLRGSTPVHATILAGTGEIELYLTAAAARRGDAEDAVASAAADAQAVLGLDVVSSDGRRIEAVVGDLLVERAFRIGIAESCTGGLVTSRLTDVAGSSRYVEMSVVTYSNEAKMAFLDVPPALLAMHGAVSEPVAVAMAAGIRARADVEVSLGITGIAGPGGGSPDKPVGTVAIAAATPQGSEVRLFRFTGEREQVKFRASQAALDLVRRLLLQSVPQL